MSFCPKCGRKTIKGFCADCIPIEPKTLSELRIVICSKCKRFCKHNQWSKINYQELFRKYQKQYGMKFPELLPKPGQRSQFKIMTDMGVMPVSILISICPLCSKKTGNYYEAILQLRNLNPEMNNIVSSFIEKHDIHVSKSAPTKNGQDLQVSDKKQATQLGRFLKENYGGTLKISPKLYSEDKQSGKKIYRLSIFYQAPSYSKGQVLKIDDKLILLTSIKKYVSGIDLKRQKRVSMDISSKSFEILAPVETRVVKVFPQIEVLDPETYQSVTVENEKPVTLDKKVNVIKDNGLYYLL